MTLSTAGSRKSLELSETELAKLEKELDEVRIAVPARSYHFPHIEAFCLPQIERVLVANAVCLI